MQKIRYGQIFETDVVVGISATMFYQRSDTFHGLSAGSHRIKIYHYSTTPTPSGIDLSPFIIMKSPSVRSPPGKLPSAEKSVPTA